jgi:hypothetical protein
VKASSLHALHAGATVVALLLLAAPEPSRAHVLLQPGVVERGAATELRIELPVPPSGERVVWLELEADGLEVLGVRRLGPAGPEPTWSARVRVSAPPGPLPLLLRQVTATGANVEVRQTLTVVPAPARATSWGRGAAVAAALAAGAAALVAARHRGRRG